MRIALLMGCVLCIATAGTPAVAQDKSKATVKRGEYLTVLGGCNDCHSPKLMTAQGPQPDPARLLSGHPAGMSVAPVPPGTLSPDKWAVMTNGELTAWVGPWGTSFAANLTPDVGTGLGGWTAAQFIQTARTGRHLGVGRPLLPPMPTPALAVLTDADLKAIYAYLRSLKPISNQVPAPLPPR